MASSSSGAHYASKATKYARLSGGGLLAPFSPGGSSQRAPEADWDGDREERRALKGKGRAIEVDSDEDVTFVSSSEATKAPRPVKKKPAAKTKRPVFVTDLPLPPELQRLEKVFKSLNTVYTFCQARKGMTTTFETMRKGVEGLLGGPIKPHDIAQIKSLLPSLITFAYVDAEKLRVHFQTGNSPQRGGTHGQMLYFAFNDGELKAANGLGNVFSRNKRGKKPTPQEELILGTPQPQISAKSMTNLISKRNDKFTSAISELLVACAASNPPLDPVKLLMDATAEHLPALPSEREKDANGRGGGSLSDRKEDLEFYARNPDARPSIEDLLAELKRQDNYNGEIVEDGHRIIEPREPRFGELTAPLSTAIWDALYETKSIKQLYSHQALAINSLLSPTNPAEGVIVATATSSGKSLIYQLPVLDALEKDLGARAMFVFPTKALAQDQKRSLAELLGAYPVGPNGESMEDVKVATFDGDTPKEDRDYIRENASVIFTNPDMLHITILPQEEKWRTFFSNLKYVVVDELHTCSGLFGCHVAFVMRRLRRICAAVGNKTVKFISCSATIGNPAEHMKMIFGIETVEVISEDGSPSGRKEHVIWNPSFIDEHDVKQGRVSTITEASKIFRFLMERGIRAIVFCKIRMQCEILMKQVRQDLMEDGRDDMLDRVMSYRSGYSAQDRRKIERDMFSGHLLGIVATTALELGIDIGSLDAVITVGFPYTLPGLRQQAGRAGRRNKDALAMLICDPFPIDQHYARQPNLIFDAPNPELSLDLDNPIIFEAHLQCAAFEIPVHPADDSPFFGPSLFTTCEEQLVSDREGFYHCSPQFLPNPARNVPIRNTEDESYGVIDITNGANEHIEELEFSRAIFTVYEGAVYMHQGRTFLCREVDHGKRIAKVEESAVDWRTRQRDYTNIDPMEALKVREIAGSECTASYGTIKITSVIFGYFKTDRKSNILDTVDVSSPPFIRSTHGLWLDVPRAALDILTAKNIHPAASIHAAEHALLSLTPMVAMCSEGDVRTECKPPEKELSSQPTTRKRPARLILYDSAGKSSGICAKAFNNLSALVIQAADAIKNCKCTDGCPSCVAIHSCAGANTIVSKLGAWIVLDTILNRFIDVDAIPMQEPLAGAVPGGTIDFSNAVGRPFAFPNPVRYGPQPVGSADQEAEEEEAREAAVRRALGAGNASTQPPATPPRTAMQDFVDDIDDEDALEEMRRMEDEMEMDSRVTTQGRLVYSLDQDGGFLKV